MVIEEIIPYIIENDDGRIKKATITSKMENFALLMDI